MSAHDAPAHDTLAFQLVAALEKYDEMVARMVETWLDMDLYREVSEQVEHIRMLTAALPHFSVCWVELLIGHAELVHSLWRLRFKEHESERAKLDEVRERHSACVASMRRQCMRILAGGADRLSRC
jgi:hypothetical protein